MQMLRSLRRTCVMMQVNSGYRRPSVRTDASEIQWWWAVWPFAPSKNAFVWRGLRCQTRIKDKNLDNKINFCKMNRFSVVNAQWMSLINKSDLANWPWIRIVCDVMMNEMRESFTERVSRWENKLPHIWGMISTANACKGVGNKISRQHFYLYIICLSTNLHVTILMIFAKNFV